MMTQLATVLGTIAFFIQNIMEFIKPLLEKYVPGFDFSDIKIIQRKMSLLDKIYSNTLHGTTAKDIEVDPKKEDFTFGEEMNDVIKLRSNLSKKIRSREKAKSRRYMVLGIIFGIVICLIVSKLTGLTYFSMFQKSAEASSTFWIVDSILAGVLVGFGSKPVNDVLNFFNGSPKPKTA